MKFFEKYIATMALVAMTSLLASTALAQTKRFDELANLPFQTIALQR